jgi:hypothetical protein
MSLTRPSLRVLCGMGIDAVMPGPNSPSGNPQIDQATVSLSATAVASSSPRIGESLARVDVAVATEVQPPPIP